MYPIAAVHGNRGNWLKREMVVLVPVTRIAVKYSEHDANGTPSPRRAEWVMIVGRIIGWFFVLAAVAAAARDMAG